MNSNFKRNNGTLLLGIPFDQLDLLNPLEISISDTNFT